MYSLKNLSKIAFNITHRKCNTDKTNKVRQCDTPYLLNAVYLRNASETQSMIPFITVPIGLVIKETNSRINLKILHPIPEPVSLGGAGTLSAIGSADSSG